MPKHHPLTPFLSPLQDLLKWLKHSDVPHLIIGGVAVSLLGRARATRDIDSVAWIDIAALDALYRTAKKFRFIPRQADALNFARRHRILLMQHQPSGIDIDISLGALPFELEAIRRRRFYKVGPVSVPLPTPEDLIIMKATAHRRVDLADIEGLIDVHPNLERRRIRYWVKKFSSALEAPEIYADLNRLLRPRPK